MASQIPDGPWTLGQGECDGKPMLMRLNTGASPFVGDPRYGQRLDVAIPHRAPNPAGLPQPAEALEIGKLEDQLVAALTSGGAGAFVLAVTTGGVTELVFYVAEAAASVARVEELARTLHGRELHGRELPHTLEHSLEHDPEWDVYLQFAEAAGAA